MVPGDASRRADHTLCRKFLPTLPFFDTFYQFFGVVKKPRAFSLVLLSLFHGLGGAVGSAPDSDALTFWFDSALLSIFFALFSLLRSSSLFDDNFDSDELVRSDFLRTLSFEVTCETCSLSQLRK